eukprot:gnl/Hemi2/22406_TR7469_c0_g1_i1.p1 gnl/Hemi2/22406_TR7469_c0_g1~~gnl/Hemi2/22406_TR7469_c0_g1_i1.p1  ORF type:complete len:647 (-),score=165.26 gnl/Hemi2/22406_TR7469_c0_g1_i1:86-1990(-)
MSSKLLAKHDQGKSKRHAPCSSSDNSSDSEKEIKEVFVEVVKNKKKCKPDRKRSRSSSSSEDRKCRKPKKKHCKRSRSRSRSSSRSHCKPEKRCRSPPPCENFEAVYREYRHLLKHDPELMVAGSSAYTTLYSTQVQSVALDQPLSLDSVAVSKNTRHPLANGEVYLDEEGLYSVTCDLETNGNAQVGMYVNSQLQQGKVFGVAAGSSQLSLDTLIALEKHDGVLLRNHITGTSSGTTIAVPQNAGGSSTQANLQFNFRKVAPHPRHWYRCHEKYCPEHPHTLKLFHHLEKALLDDPRLMLTGPKAYGEFFSQSPQTVAVGAPFLFDKQLHVKGLCYDSATGLIHVLEDGVYIIHAQSVANKVQQTGIILNGTPIPWSVTGTNVAGAQLLSRFEGILHKNDQLSLNNYTSAGPTTTVLDAGGATPAINAELTIIQIAPLPKAPRPSKCRREPVCVPEEYEKFKRWLLGRKHLQLKGAEAVLGAGSSSTQQLPANAAVQLMVEWYKRHVDFVQGNDHFKIQKSGLYLAKSFIISAQANQFALNVNGVLKPLTVTGQEAGGSRLNVENLIQLKEGDCVQFVNSQSSVLPVVTLLNPGGSEVAISASFSLLFVSHGECEYPYSTSQNLPSTGAVAAK